MCLDALEFGALAFEGFFLVEAGLFFFGYQCLALFALGTGAGIFAAEAVEFEASDGEARSGSGVFFG